MLPQWAVSAFVLPLHTRKVGKVLPPVDVTSFSQEEWLLGMWAELSVVRNHSPYLSLQMAEQYCGTHYYAPAECQPSHSLDCLCKQNSLLPGEEMTSLCKVHVQAMSFGHCLKQVPRACDVYASTMVLETTTSLNYNSYLPNKSTLLGVNPLALWYEKMCLS
jgi:hypothetical protein